MNNKQNCHQPLILKKTHCSVISVAASSEQGDLSQGSAVIIKYHQADPWYNEIKTVCTGELDFIKKERGKESHLTGAGFTDWVTSG